MKKMQPNKGMGLFAHIPFKNLKMDSHFLEFMNCRPSELEITYWWSKFSNWRWYLESQSHKNVDYDFCFFCFEYLGHGLLLAKSIGKVWKANAKFASKILKRICRPNEIEFDKIRHILWRFHQFGYTFYMSCSRHSFTNSRFQ